MAFISNGKTVASGGSVTVSSSSVLTATARATAGAVGGYILAKNNATQSPNATFSGNNSDSQYGGRGNTNITSGTYRVMGDTHSSNDTTRLTVALRIS